MFSKTQSNFRGFYHDFRSHKFRSLVLNQKSQEFSSHLSQPWASDFSHFSDIWQVKIVCYCYYMLLWVSPCSNSL